MPDRKTSALSRREVVSLGVGAFVLASIPLAVATRRRALSRRRLPLMGTIAEIAVVHDDPRRAQDAIDAAFSRMQGLEQALTRYADASDIGRSNREATQRPVRVSAETARVVGEALRWAEATAGAFDPCLGALIAAWDVDRRREPLPPEEIERWAGRRLHRSLEVGRHLGEPALRLADRDARLDLGGIGVGYAVDRAVEVLRSRGVERALVNVGGDIYALGDSEDGDPWSVGVQSPADPSTILATLRVKDRAVATSGDYVHGFDWRGRRYHHIIDPATGAPTSGPFRSMTIEADDCLTADAASTTVFGLDAGGAARALAAVAPTARLAHSV